MRELASHVVTEQVSNAKAVCLILVNQRPKTRPTRPASFLQLDPYSATTSLAREVFEVE
jgi:hypothetical protein